MANNLTLIQMRLFLRDLFEKRETDLLLTKAGQYFAPQLRVKRDEIEGLPPALTQRAPFADELALADGRHDGFGAAIFHATEVAFRLPDASVDTLAAARRLREAFIPGLGELKDTYAVEADRAIEREPKLATLADDLRRFPVPDGRTLLEVATSYLASGRTLHDLLSRRGDVPKAVRARAAAIRSETVGMVNRLRDDLARELAKDSALPRDLDQRVFGYLDTLVAMAPAGTTTGEPTPPATTPTPGPTTVG